MNDSMPLQRSGKVLRFGLTVVQEERVGCCIELCLVSGCVRCVTGEVCLPCLPFVFIVCLMAYAWFGIQLLMH